MMSRSSSEDETTGIGSLRGPQAARAFYRVWECPQEDDAHMEARIRIQQCIMEGKMSEAISHINELAPELLDDQPMLYFQIRQQELIELIRSGNVESAIAFSQEHLAEIGESRPACLRDLERTLSLLAFENAADCPFSELLDGSHRAQVADRVNSAIFGAAGLRRRSQLCVLAQQVSWCQAQLDAKCAAYDKMTDLADAHLQPTKGTNQPMQTGKSALASMLNVRSQR